MPSEEPLCSWCRPSVVRRYVEDVRADSQALVRVLETVDERLLFESLSPSEGVMWVATLERLRAIVTNWRHGHHVTVGTQFEIAVELLKNSGRRVPQAPT